MADDSNDYNTTENYDDDEDARSDVTYFDLDAVEEVTEVTDVSSEQNNAPQKQELNTSQEDDDINDVSDDSEQSDEDSELVNLEVKENSCRLCLKDCEETDTEMADYVDYYTYCTSYCIYADDIPKKICEECKVQIMQLFSFKKKCKRIEFVIKQAAKQNEIQIDFEEPVIDQAYRAMMNKNLTVYSKIQNESFDLSDPAVKAQIESCLQNKGIGRPRKDPNALAKPYPIPGRPPGRPRVEKPVLPKRPLGRPRGTARPSDPNQIKRKPGRPEGTLTVNDLVPRGRIGRPPGSKNKKSISDVSDLDESQPLVGTPNTKKSKYTESIGEGLDVLRGDLPSDSKAKGKKGPRPEHRKYQAENDRILCAKCGRVFLESERRIMYNHMHKHRVEERQAAATAAAIAGFKQENTRDYSESSSEAKEVSQPSKVEYIVVGRPAPVQTVVTSNQGVQQDTQATHQVYYRPHWN